MGRAKAGALLCAIALLAACAGDDDDDSIGVSPSITLRPDSTESGGDGIDDDAATEGISPGNSGQSDSTEGGDGIDDDDSMTETLPSTALSVVQPAVTSAPITADPMSFDRVGICERVTQFDRIPKVTYLEYDVETGAQLRASLFSDPNLLGFTNCAIANTINDDLTRIAWRIQVDDDQIPGWVDQQGTFTASVEQPADESFSGGVDIEARDVAFRPGTNEVWWTSAVSLNSFAHPPTDVAGDPGTPLTLCTSRHYGLQFTTDGRPVDGSGGPDCEVVPDDQLDARHGLLVRNDNPEGIDIPQTDRFVKQALLQPSIDTLVFMTSGPDNDDPDIVWRSGASGPIVPEELLSFDVGADRKVELVWIRSANS